ncbi:hypothetical protein [Thaumasiovibrio sp. DFM-14]|uniref:hypothetical protein n=1 Tax=Thaumasiovibrio sp. DFM-14 TaxID=3384792 RepID=UPI0039A09C9C
MREVLESRRFTSSNGDAVALKALSHNGKHGVMLSMHLDVNVSAVSLFFPMQCVQNANKFVTAATQETIDRGLQRMKLDIEFANKLSASLEQEKVNPTRLKPSWLKARPNG